MNVGTLTIEMAANVARLANDMQKAQSTVEGAMKKISAAAKVGLASLAAGVSVAGITAFVKSAINAADEMSKLSQKTGVAVKDLAGLQLAYQQSGIQAGALQTSMARLAQGMAKGNDAFAAMQLSTKNADGSLKSTRDMLGEVADKFASYKDGAEKTAIAMQLFGKAGADMIPLLNGGAAGLAEFDAMAQQLGLTMDEATAKSAEKFNDTLDLVSMGVSGVGTQIAAQLLPTLTGLAGEFLTTMTSGDKLKTTAEFLATALKGLYVAGLAVVEAFKTVGTTLGGVFAAIGAAVTGDFASAKTILSELKTDIGTSWIKTLEQAQAAWDTTGNAAVEAMAATSAAAKGAAPNVEDVAEQAKAAEKALAAAGKALDKYFEAEDKAAEARVKTMGDMAHLVDALERQVEAVEQGEAATKAMNRELAIENALRSDAAQKLLPHQREEYAKLVAQQYDMQEALKVAEDAQKAAAAEATKSAEAMQTAYNRAIERVRDGVGDFFVAMIRDGKASFDTLLDFFKQMIAEMIATAAANKIMVGMGLMGGASGGSAGSAGGGVNLSNLGTLWSGAKAGYNWMTGGASSAAGVLSNPYVTNYGVHSGMLTPNVNPATGLTYKFNPGAAAANMAAGYAGQYAVSQVYQGRESSGIGGTAGGIIGSYWGPWGSAAGAAIGEALDRALSGSDITGKRVKLGIGTGSMVEGDSAWTNQRTLASGLQVGDLAVRASDMNMSGDEINAYLSTFDQLDSALTALARAAGAAVDLSGQALPGMVQSYDGGTSGGAFFGSLAKGELRQQMQDAPGEFVRQWLAATSDAFDAEVRPFLSRIDGSVEQMLSQFGSITDISAAYKASTDGLKALLETDTIGAVQQQIEDANRSLYQLWSDQGDAIVKFSTELADAEDFAQLTGMVQQRYATELALIGQVMGALQQIDGIFASTIEGIKLDLMKDNGERYKYFETQIETLTGALGSMSDPGQILDTLKQIDQLSGRAYGLLDDTQKQAIGQDIIGYLTEAEAIGTKRLDAVLASVSSDKVNEPGTVGNAIVTAMDQANGKMITQLEAVFAKGAADQKAAADTLQGAATQFGNWVSYLPGTINVTLAGSEVNA